MEPKSIESVHSIVLEPVMLLNSATMDQGWNAHDSYADKYGTASQETRGQTSLIMGQHFLERCTSAPLPSSSFDKDKNLTGDMLVGNVSGISLWCCGLHMY